MLQSAVQDPQAEGNLKIYLIIIIIFHELKRHTPHFIYHWSEINLKVCSVIVLLIFYFSSIFSSDFWSNILRFSVDSSKQKQPCFYFNKKCNFHSNLTWLDFYHYLVFSTRSADSDVFTIFSERILSAALVDVNQLKTIFELSFLFKHEKEQAY